MLLIYIILSIYNYNAKDIHASHVVYNYIPIQIEREIIALQIRHTFCCKDKTIFTLDFFSKEGHAKESSKTPLPNLVRCLSDRSQTEHIAWR